MRAALLVLLIATTAHADSKFTIKDNRLELPSPIAFATGSAKLTPDSDAALDHAKAYLAEKSYITTLRIENHTDEPDQQALSDARALAVAKALVAKGVECGRLIPVGFGNTKPVAANDTPAHRAQNRRTEFVNAALRGRSIGGLPVDGGGHVAGDACK